MDDHNLSFIHYRLPKGIAKHPYRHSLYAWNIHVLELGYATVHLCGILLNLLGYIHISVGSTLLCIGFTLTLAAIQRLVYFNGMDHWPSWDRNFFHIPCITFTLLMISWWIAVPSIRESILFTWLGIGSVTYCRMSLQAIAGYVLLVLVLYVLFALFIVPTVPMQGHEIACLLSFTGLNVFLGLHSQVLRRHYQSIVHNEEEIQKLNLQLKQQAEFDMLTQTYNRHKLESVNQTPLAGLLFIDIDHFKEYNDYLGHVAGDQCLVQLALCLSNMLTQQMDLIRYGGDEFLIIFYTLPQNTEYFVECVHLAILNKQIPHPSSPIHHAVTASIGGVYTAAGRYSLNELLTAADKILYQVKSNGRNNFRLEKLS